MQAGVAVALLLIALGPRAGHVAPPAVVWRQSGTDLRFDARLDKPISLRLKIVPLSECAKAFSSATGVRIQVARSIEDRKVTAVFRDKPATEAMAMLANTMFCKWSPESRGYRLDMPRDVRNEEIRMVDAEHEVIREQIAAVVRKMAAAASRPKDESTDARDKLARQIMALQNSKDPEVKRQLQNLQNQYRQFEYLGWWEIGFALKSASGAPESLASGATVFASTKQGEALPLPYSATPTFTSKVVVPGPDGKPQMETRTPSGSVAALRINSLTGELECKIIATGVLPAAGQTSKTTRLLSSNEAQVKLMNQPLRKRLREWGKTLDSAMLGIKPSAPAVPEVSPGYTAQAMTMADQLEYLSDSTGIAVIADAFRVPASGEQYLTGNSVGQAISQLTELTMDDVRRGTFRTEKGWLLFRHPHYWRMLDSEIPESLFAPLEARVLGKENLTLDDYTAFASSLTPWQALAFPYRTPLTRFPRLPLFHAMPALRLWASLSDDQRRIAYISGLSFKQMSPAQQDLFRLAANELLWIGAINETLLPVLMGETRSIADTGLFMQDGQNGAHPGYNLDESLEPSPQKLTIADIRALDQHSYSFTFGNS